MDVQAESEAIDGRAGLPMLVAIAFAHQPGPDCAVMRPRERRLCGALLAGLIGLLGFARECPALGDDATRPAEARGVAKTAASHERVVFDRKSKWNRILVIDRKDERSLFFGDGNGDTQSTVSLRDPRAVPMEYIRHAGGALAFTPKRGSALVVGLGGGTYPMLLRRSFPAMTIDVVELDPMVRAVARDYFGFVEDGSMRVHIADGAAFIRRTRRRWDIIFLDAYGAAGVPAALATGAFFAGVARRLAPGGLVIANVSENNPNRERVLITRIRNAFRECILQRTPTSDNVIVVAGFALPKDIEGSLRQLDREGALPFPVAPMAPLHRSCPK